MPEFAAHQADAEESTRADTWSSAVARITKGFRPSSTAQKDIKISA
jgi:hypothetical protein